MSLFRNPQPDMDKKAEYLIDAGADLELMDDRGLTALSYAVLFRVIDDIAPISCPWLKTAKILLDNGAKINDNLLNAVYTGDTGMINLLIRAGAEIEYRDRDGRTALSLAAIRGDIEAAKILLENGADYNTRDTLSGMAPMDHARSHLQIKMAAFLERRQAMQNEKIFETLLGSPDSIARYKHGDMAL